MLDPLAQLSPPLPIHIVQLSLEIPVRLVTKVIILTPATSAPSETNTAKPTRLMELETVLNAGISAAQDPPAEPLLPPRLTHTVLLGLERLEVRAIPAT
jgi:hypothetical protein